jgi:CheY-like chemotaxis protein
MTGHGIGVESGLPTVVVIDDSAAVRGYFELCMGPLAVDVKSYPSASASLEYLSGGSAALIFLDIIMPGKDGLTFLEELRSHPLHRDTPVVVMSSKDYRQDKGIARQLGAEYVTKPVASRTIQDLVIRFARAEPRGAAQGA